APDRLLHGAARVPDLLRQLPRRPRSRAPRARIALDHALPAARAGDRVRGGGLREGAERRVAGLPPALRARGAHPLAALAGLGYRAPGPPPGLSSLCASAGPARAAGGHLCPLPEGPPRQVLLG